MLHVVDMLYQECKQIVSFLLCLNSSQTRREMDCEDMECVARRDASPGMEYVAGGSPMMGSEDGIGEADGLMGDILKTVGTIDNGYIDATCISGSGFQVFVTDTGNRCFLCKVDKAGIRFYLL